MAGGMDSDGPSRQASVAEYVINEFQAVAKILLEKATPQVPLYATPEYARYDKLLKCLRLVGKANVPAVFDALWAWRARMEERLSGVVDTISIQCRRAVIECTLMETCLQLLEELPPPCSSVLGKGAEELERLAFSLAISAEQIISRPEAGQHLQRVVALSSHVIGALARGRLEAVSAMFFRMLENRIHSESTTHRQEIIALCAAMKHVRLSFDSEHEMAAAVNFLQHANPLRHANIPMKKSQVHHALASMLSSILLPLVVADVPRRGAEHVRVHLDKWFKTVATIEKSTTDWAVKKSKHVQDGYPLMTYLVCLEEDATFFQTSNRLVKKLHKQLRLKECRALTIDCLIQCIQCWLHRSSQARSGAVESKHMWLERVCKPVTSSVKKGFLTTTEQQDLVVKMCLVICDVAPDFAVEHIILGLLECDSVEGVTTGLRALMEMLLFEAQKLRGAKPSSPFRTPTLRASLDRHELEAQLLSYVAGGNHALKLLGLSNAISVVTERVGDLMDTYRHQFGNMALTNNPKSFPDMQTKDLMSGINAFCWALRLVPYIVPQCLMRDGLAEVLPLYTAHAEAAVSQVACRALSNVLSGMPQMRNNIVNGMMRSVVRIDDLNTQAILDGLRNALNLLQDWQNLATSPASPPDPAGFDVHHMEGLALTFLCSVDVPIRVAAVNILKASQKLHQTLRKKAQSGDQGLQLPEDTTYVMDVLEEMGPNIVEHCYWDFGEWSDMWRRWRHVDEGVSLWDAMRAFSTDESDLRWSRCLGEMAIETSCTCEAALDVAYAEGCHKLTKLMSTDSKGTLSLPHDAVDGGRLNLWRNYCAFCCGCPLYKKQISRTEGVLTTAELFRLLVVPLTGAPVAHQQSAILALGHCNAECYDVLFRELRNASSRANLKAKSKSKFEEVRLHMANVLRIVAYSMPPGTLNNNVLRKQFLLFMDSTVHTLVSHPLDGLYDVHQLCYCLCSIAASTALELIGSSGDGLTAEMRKTLFNLCSQWCAPGYPPGRYEEDMKYLKAAVLAKVKDTGSQKEVEDDFALSCSHLEHAARTAMVAMLQGPLFDNDKRLTGTSIGTWIDYLMTSGRPNDVRFGPSKCSIARQALTKLLVSNLFLFDPYVDQCYSANSVVATVYFQVICEVYCSYADVDGKTGVLLSLVLYKANDEEKEVREDALHLLKVIAEREWNGPIGVGWSVGCGGDVMLNNAVVLGSVQDSCQCFQYQLSETLAREHPEVNEELCVELMTRQLSSANQQVLLCLIPWMERLSFSSRWEGEWSERLLKSMYYVTWKHGKQFTYEVEKLWSTVSSNKENIVPILDFLVSFGMKECASQDAETLLQYFSVLKRISLYLARTSPQRTIDHWVSEASQMIQSEDELGQEEEDKDKNMSALKFSTLDQRGGLLELAPQRLDSIVAAPESAHPSSLKFRDSQDIPPFSVQSATSPWSDGSASSFRSATDYPLLPSSSLKRSTSNISAPGSDRRGSEVSAPFLKGFLTQPELALTLLVEVAFEHGEKFNEHLPVLFHIAVICMDSVKPVVRLHCQQLIVNLLNALAKQQLRATKHPEQNAKLAKLAALISSLQSMKGQPLWPHEDVDLRTGGLSSEDAVSEFVNAILSCSNDESTLRTQWIQEASTWAVECRHRHAAWRSHQVLRALQPAPSSELFLNLLQCLKACFSSPTAAAMQSVLELLRTLKAVMSRLPPSKMVLYPQIFWTCVALLPSDYVHIFRASVEVLHYMLQCSSLSNDIILNVLLATAPTSAHNAPILYSDALPAGQVEGAIYSQDYTWSHTLQQWAIGAQLLLLESGNEQSPVLCLQQLLLKGVCMPDIQTSTLVLITLLAKQMAQNPSGLFGPLNMMTKNGEDHEASVEVHVDPFRTAFSSVLGDLHAQLFTSLMGIVPWICVAICNQNREHIAEACEALARACDYNKFDGIGATVMAFIETDAQGLESAVQDFCSSLCEEAPAMFICVMVGQWTSLVQNSDLTYARVGMTLLGGVFASRGRGGLQSNAAAIADLAVNSTLFAALGAHLQGSLNHEAKRVLSSMVSCASGQTAVEDGPQWATALEIGLQLQTSTVFNTEQVVAALSAMLETCPQHLRKNSRRVVMPFVSPSAPMSEPRTSGQVR